MKGGDDGVPVFACVGAVNTGKTSTIAALIEDDHLRITDRPGETVKCQEFSVELAGRELVRFVDTPGFQNGKAALVRLRELEDPVGDPLEAFRRFLELHGSDAGFSEECKLFEPLVRGAGILYVVDASQPFREMNDAEMKILLMSGRPRLGLINVTGEPVHAAVWEARLGQHFNLVRRFDAHAADFGDRMELLKALMGIDAGWRRALERAVEVYERDWARRREDCAEVVAELLLEALQHRVTGAVARGGSGALGREREAELIGKFQDGLREMERRAHGRLIEIFKHRRVAVDGTGDRGAVGGALGAVDLFAEDVWRLCGLDEKQLVVAATVAGAVLGVAVDVALAGHSLGLAAVIGGALGGGSALVAGKRRPNLEVKLPGELGRFFGRQKLAGRDLRVGPLREINFPWILLDRAVAVFYYAARRSHARRDELAFRLEDQLAVLRGRRVLTQEWPESARKECERIFTLARKGRADVEQRKRLREIVTERLANCHVRDANSR